MLNPDSPSSDGSPTALSSEHEKLVLLARDELRNLGFQEKSALKGSDVPTFPENLWDRYERIESLGKGGLAEVFKVKKIYLNNIAALKVLLPKHHDSLRTIARFWAEGRIMGTLGGMKEHHLVRVMTMGRSADNQFFIEMEFVRGKTLSELLKEQGNLPPLYALYLLRQLAMALRHVHKHHIIHRDIKPQNIIVNENDHLTVMDFGVAKRLDSDSITSKSGMFIGTPIYAAPEQFDSAAFGPVSERTDIYALGILGYQLLTNHFPFEGTTHEIIYGHCHKPLPQFPPQFRISEKIIGLIAKCTKKHPKDRFQCMRDVEVAITNMLEAEAIEEYKELFVPFAHLPQISQKQRQGLKRHQKILGLSREMAESIENNLIDIEKKKQENQIKQKSWPISPPKTSKEYEQIRREALARISDRTIKIIAEWLKISVTGFFNRLKPNARQLVHDKLLHLTRSTIKSKDIDDVSFLEGLTNLQSLDLSDTQITDLLPLAGLSQLSDLYLRKTKVCDLSPLSGLLQLQSLFLYRTQVIDLSPLTNLIRLQSLDLYDTPVRDLSPLAYLSQLQFVDLSGTHISTLSPLKKLTRLQSLHLKRTQIEDLSPLSNLLQMQSLNLSYTPVSDLSPLFDLINLRRLELIGVDVAKSHIENLQEYLPYCQIVTARCSDNNGEKIIV